MATIVTVAPTRPRSRFDHVFFPAMSAAILTIAVVGFAQTYYLGGFLTIPRFKAFAAPPHPLVVHVHAVAFSAWVLLLMLQTSLVSNGRIDRHRRIGLFGFALACLVVLAGAAVVCEDLARHLPLGDVRIGTASLQVFRVVSFAVLVYFAYRQRSNPSEHKRLVLIATIGLLPAALVRWPVLIAGNFFLALACCVALLAAVALYDLWSTRKLHLPTLLGSGLVIATNPPIIIMALGHNAIWFRIATHMQAIGRVLL